MFNLLFNIGYILHKLELFIRKIFPFLYKKENKDWLSMNISQPTLYEVFDELRKINVSQYVTSYVKTPFILYDKRNGNLLEHHKGNEYSVPADIKTYKVTEDVLEKMKNSEKCYVYTTRKYKLKNKNEKDGLIIRMFLWPEDVKKEQND